MNVVWAVNIVGECALLLVMLWRRDHVRYPQFATFIGFCVVRSFVLVAMAPPNTQRYAIAYFIGTAMRIPLIAAVLIDLLYWVVKPFLMVSASRSTLFIALFLSLCGYAGYIGVADRAGGEWLTSAILTADRSVDLALAGAVLLLVLSPRMRGKWNKRERGIVLGFLYLVPQCAQYFIRYHVSLHAAMLLDIGKMTAFTAALLIWLIHFLLPEGALVAIGAGDMDEAEHILGSACEELRVKTGTTWLR